MITASTALTIFIMNIHHCGPGAKPVPQWARKFILQYMARMFFVYEVGESCKSPRPEPDTLPKIQVANGVITKEERKGPVKLCRGLSPPDEALPPRSPSQGVGSRTEQPDWTESAKYVDLEPVGGESQEQPSGIKGQCLCQHESIITNVEYIAKCFRNQKASQKRTAEWKKVAKVMDRFFMWVFFAMVFIMSVLIMGQSI